MCKYTILTSILVLTSFTTNAEEATADTSGWFIGGMAGHGSVEIKSVTHTNDKNGVSTLGVYGGYRFGERFSLEAALFGTGELADNQAHLTSAQLGLLTVTPKFTYKINSSFALTVKGGIAHLIYEEEYDNYILYERDYDQSWSGSGGVIGLGAQFSFSQNILFRINYDRIIATLDVDKEQYYTYSPDVDIDLEQISIGVHYQF
ncbi:MAG: porin family protein [Gammaproteobacteria bacterium]|nr:porin family protein [Gammaproteobacteria bacterium]